MNLQQENAERMLSAIKEMLQTAATTQSIEELNHLLINKIKQSHEDYWLVIFPSSDLPIKKNRGQYVWPFAYFNEKGDSILNGGIMFSKDDHSWSSQA